MNGISSLRHRGVQYVVLDRPKKLNAVDTPMLRQLATTFADAHDDEVRVVVLTGACRAFCSGGDLSSSEAIGAADAANDVVQAIVTLPKPVVAGVRGPAAGFGCSLALACDLVVAAQSSTFQLAFTKVGLMPDGGASSLLPMSVGRQRAARMAFLAEKFSAATVYEWGLISHLVDDDRYDDELASVARLLADGPTQSYRWIKQALATATLAQLGQVQAIEAAGQAALVRTRDFAEGARAFRERRRAVFEGR